MTAEFGADAPEDISPEIIAEQAVLGTAVNSSEAAAVACAALRPEHFSRTAHRVVFEAVERLSSRGVEVEPSAVLGELAAVGLLAKVGAPGMGTGGAYLHSLMERGGSIAYHAPVVLGAARKRAILTALQSAAQAVSGPGFDPAVSPEQVRQLVEDACAVDERSTLRLASEAVTEVLAAIEAGEAPGISTGLPDLDDAIGALRPQELIVIGARPATGKTLVAMVIADHVATTLALPVLFASLEMTEAELTMRRVAAAARVPLHHLTRHQVSDAEWDMIDRAHPKLSQTELRIDDTSGQSLAHIRGRLREMERAGEPARLLVIDYLGFVTAPKAESRQQAVSALARGFKLLAREFRIPVILLSQLNRGLEGRSDRMPSMSDLRESGEIEQSADIIILLHREDAKDPESPRAGEIDLIIAKNRQGPVCTVTCLFQGHYGRVASLARPWSHMAAAGGER